jgi:protein-S-isoprenylcysteine O-methyltransferase Ste14
MARESSARHDYWRMSGTLVTVVAVASIVTFMLVAQLSRARGVARRGETLARSRGLAHYIAYFFFVPYVVIAAPLGPELDVPQPLRWLGCALTVLGVGFAIWAIATLGRHYDLELEIHRDHELVRAGPYRVVRHPIYTGLALHFIGTCLATGNLLLIVGTVLVTFPAFYLRAKTEEALLRERFGEQYETYAREVGMLVPLP